MGLAVSFNMLLGVGLASGIANNESWSAANDISSGALILAGYDRLQGFGKFCGVIVALGLIADNIPGTYSAALGFQMLGIPQYDSTIYLDVCCSWNLLHLRNGWPQ